MTHRRRLHILVLLLVVVAVMPAAAGAHDLYVARPGSVELDLGLLAPPRLVHATLEAPADTVTATFNAHPGERYDVVLLVPDAEPERSVGAAKLPSADVTSDAGAGFAGKAASAKVVDEVTGIAYREVSRAAVDGDDAGAGRLTVRVARGSAPTRVALWVAPADADFATDDPERTPRTLLALRAWAQTPAKGSVPAGRKPGASSGEGNVLWALYAAGLALIAVVTAAWWVRAGRRRSRERGVERQRGE